MGMIERALGIGMLAAAAGCAPQTPPSPPASEVRLPREQAGSVAASEGDAALPARARRECVVRGDGSGVARDDVTLYADAELSVPLVVVERESGVQLAWYELDPSGVVRVRMGGQGLARIDGWSRLGPGELRLRHDHALRGGHVTLRTHTPPAAFGRTGDGTLEIAVETGLVEPARVTAEVPCSELRWARAERDPDAAPRGTWQRYRVRSDRLTLLDAPGGSPVTTLVFPPGEGFARHDEDGDAHARVVVEAGGVTFRGWALHSELVLPPQRLGVGGSWGRGGHRARRPRVRRPTPTEVATIAADTTLWVGSDAGSLRVAGVAERGAVVRFDAAEHGRTRIAFDGWLTAPDDQAFYVLEASLTDRRIEDRGPSFVRPALPVLDERSAP